MLDSLMGGQLDFGQFGNDKKSAANQKQNLPSNIQNLLRGLQKRFTE